MWQISFTINRQQQFKTNLKMKYLRGFCALYSDVNGDYIKKPITECSGNEICQEWLYHIGVPTDKIEDLAKHASNTIPVYMPYITSYFMTRAIGDRLFLVVRINHKI